MPLSCSFATRATLIGLIAATLSACASAPKPMGPAATAPSPPPPRTMPAPGPGPVIEGDQTGAPRPGSARDFVINAGDLVYFDTDRFNVRDDARGILDAQAAWLGRYPAVRVRIEGNCDERGTREYNFALGARRAAAVKDYLVGHGLSAGRIETVSFGKEHPLDAGSGDPAESKNRNAHTLVTDGAR